ncbi:MULTISPECIES: tetratricopeptide repeat protein [Saccharibacillus]|uniref:tetratricopeptide repeat protein n=1 Tax=Saccharibacillus TaxID=456492 RepID=UPI0012387E66|nr:DNA-binding protein [Saccharibacillus sp. WB 17]MWJ30623.1 DNA-binding protein [Saccharibacillus sp. WB 17]
MELTKTLRSEIENGIAELGMNFSSFGERSGINRGIFSAILNGTPPKPISLNQMEAITRAFGKPEGWMFDLYIEECFYDGKPNRRRVEPFLIRCAELGRTDCIREVLSRLLEDLKHVSMIFDIAETLFTTGRKQESLIFYECVVENEKYHHSERLAISYYRLFHAALGEDNEQNWRAAMRFEPFSGKLPDHYRLDGLLKLANVYLLLERWTEVELYSTELHEFVQAIYEIEKKKARKNSSQKPIPTERPLIFYYGHSFILREAVYEQEGNYEAARQCIDAYKDLSDFELPLDKSGRAEVENFKLYAKANEMNLEVLAGNMDVLDAYTEFLDENPDEVLPSFLTVLECANKYEASIDPFVDHFSPALQSYNINTLNYKRTSSLNRYASIFYELARYHFRQKRYDRALSYALQCLEMTVKISNKNIFMKSVPLFEELRSFANAEQTKTYENLMRSVYLNV